MPFCQNCGAMQYPNIPDAPCRNPGCKKVAPQVATIDAAIESYMQTPFVSGFLQKAAPSKKGSLQAITAEFRKILQEKDFRFINVAGAVEYEIVFGEHKKRAVRHCPHKALMHFIYFLDLEKKRRGADYATIQSGSTVVCEEQACRSPHRIRFGALYNINMDDLYLRRDSYSALLKGGFATRSVFEKFIVHVPGGAGGTTQKDLESGKPK